MSRLILVDGSSYLYRAYHALPALQASDGQPTGAMRGVLAMLRRLAADVAHTHFAVVFDAKGKTFRHDWYADYKANRPPMPDDLVAQIEPLYDCIRAEGWALVSVPGIEADDVIGTLATTAKAQQMTTLISTGDKDMAQLVCDEITLINTMNHETLDAAGVLAKFGVTPSQIIDYLTLVGDSSDNVPGVAKVGAKTAAKWLAQYGSLDNLTAHENELKGVVGENFRQAKDWLPQGKRLVTIKTDCELPISLNDLLADTPPNLPDLEKLHELYTRYEFKSWLKGGTSAPPKKGVSATLRAETAPAPTADIAPDGKPATLNYVAVTTTERLQEWCDKIRRAPLTALDCETNALDPMTASLVGISLATAPGDACYIPVGHDHDFEHSTLPLSEVLDALKPWLEDENAKKVGQNIKYDEHVFLNHGVQLRGIAHDTMLQSYVLEAHRPHDMDTLALAHLHWKTITYDDVTGKGAKRIPFAQVPIARATEYAAEDADVTLRLNDAFLPQLQAAPDLLKLYETMELPVREILCRMERHGVLIDRAALAKQSHELGARLLTLEQQAYALAGQPFNLASPKQLGEILFGRMGLPPVKKTATGQPSTDEDVLQQLAADYPLPKILLEHRGLAKLKSTYTDKLPTMINPKTGRVHTTFSQTTAVTGRLASSEPNLQNIPVRTEEGRRIREAFVAPDGCRLISADYSQIELRIMAHLSEDPGLLDAFRHGGDIHRSTAAVIFGVPPDQVTTDQRRMIKAVNFGLIYGMSAFGLAQQLNIDRSSAAAFIEKYFARYPGVYRYMQTTRETAKAKGYVETVFGRKLTLENINASNAARRAAAERAAINAPMQGTAADLIKLAMIAVQNWLDEQQLRTKMLLQVHDELIFETPDDEVQTVMNALPDLMQNVAQLKVPLIVNVGIGRNWDEAH
jgi:DNA polymerase-1